jgi:Skp family chaperone for outer membrane proteins
VKRSLCWAILATILSLGVYSLIALAQAPAGGQGQPPTGPRTALIDVKKIIKNHARFKGMMEDMKKDYVKVEQAFREDQQKIRKLGEELQRWHRGTPNYQDLDEEILRRTADLNIRVEKAKGEFQEREAKIYHSVYQEIWQATDYISRQYGFEIVYNFNSEKMDPEKPQTIANQINNSVVWYDARLDITGAVLDELNRDANRQQPVNPGPARQPAGPFTR